MTHPDSPIDAEALFRSWQLARAAQPRGGLSPRSLDTYRSLWNGWCQHLAAGGRTWQAARPSQVRGFLQTLAPRAQRRGLPQPSSVTQRRYYRVLQQIYGHALAQGWIAHNPVVPSASVSAHELKDSLVFHALDWQALLDALPRPQDPPAAESPWLAVRDQALLRLMMEAALTVAELAGLDLGDVEHPRLGRRRGVAVLWPASEAPTQTPVTLSLGGPRNAQHRRVALPSDAGTAVLAWLQLRAALPVPQTMDSPLFLSRKQAGRLTPRALFHLAHQHITRTLAPRHPGTVLAHAGPMTLRNSCLVRWLDAGLPEDEVLARAGLREAQALLRLRPHLQAVDAVREANGPHAATQALPVTSPSDGRSAR